MKITARDSEEFGSDGRIILPAGLYCLTGTEFSQGRSNREVVGAMLAAGAKVIQYREKDMPARKKYQECQEIREMTRQAGAVFIVNDDIDIAMLVGADGIHVGQEDLPVEQVRRLVGDRMMIGLSTHSRLQAQAAVCQGVDYVGVGPIFATATKKDALEAIGLTGLQTVAIDLPVPVVAIGGIKECHVADVLRSGATSVAIISDIVAVGNIEEKVRAIQEIIAKESKL